MSRSRPRNFPNTLSRRNFIQKSAYAGLGSVLAPAIIPSAALGQSAVWGDLQGMEFSNFTSHKILEIHCYGAPSIWETLWVTRKTNGDPDYRGFDTEMNGAEFLCPSNSSDQPSADDLEFFANDALSNEIHLGPAAKPIWHLKNKMRLIVQKHPYPEIPIHEAAVPFAVTGSRLGSPRFAASGASVAHRQIALDPTRTTPHAYVLGTGNATGINHLYNSSVTTGLHDSRARPLFLRMDSSTALLNRLSRSMPSGRDEYLDVIRGQYHDKLLFHSIPDELVRSAHFDSYQAAINATYNSPELINILTADLLTIQNTPYCIREAGSANPADKQNPVGAAINLARDLLTRDSDAASHVLVADTGLERISSSNTQPCYDTHRSLVANSFEMVRATTANLYNLFNAIAIATTPNPSDPTWRPLDLNNTLIVINMEFGRTPNPSGSGTDKGREHFSTGGYVGVLLGGPVTGPSIAGAMQNSSGNAGDGSPPDSDWFSPSDFKAAILLAAGIWPFEHENFGTTDSGPNIFAGSEHANAVNLANRILGVS